MEARGGWVGVAAAGPQASDGGNGDFWRTGAWVKIGRGDLILLMGDKSWRFGPFVAM